MLVKVNATALAEKREAKKLSQHKLSILSGLSSASIFRMENELHKVSDLRVKAVATVLGCSPDELITEEEPT
mgnify:CR=1 FL=1